jgi:hypothetical protein
MVDKKYSEAIRHYLEAGEIGKAEDAASKVLDEYLATGMVGCIKNDKRRTNVLTCPTGQIELLKNIPQTEGCHTFDGCYWVLIEYNEFHRLYKVRTAMFQVALYRG